MKTKMETTYINEILHKTLYRRCDDDEESEVLESREIVVVD